MKVRFLSNYKKVHSILLFIIFLIFSLINTACGEENKKEKIEKTPCTDINCSDNGSCILENNIAKCNCNDGFYEDGLTCNNTPALKCLTNGTQKITFKDITKDLNLEAKKMIGTNITVTDFNQDHWPDVLVTKGLSTRYDKENPKYQYAFFKNNKGNFEDYTWESGLFKTRDGEDGRITSYVIFGDVNNDGYPDALNIAYLDSNTNINLDKTDLFINKKGSNFKIFYKQSFSPDTRYSPAASALFLDYNKDGNLDLFIANQYTHYGNPFRTLTDSLYKGSITGILKDVTEEMGLKTESFTQDQAEIANANTPSWGVSACDLNDDGYEEILISTYGRQNNLLFMYENGKYINKSIESNFAYDTLSDYFDNQRFLCYCQNNHLLDLCKDLDTPLIQCSEPGRNWNAGFDDKPYRLGGNTSNSLCADFDNDGDNDILSIELAHWWVGKSSDKTQLLINNNFPINPLERINEENSGITRTRTGSWNDGDLGGVAEDLNNDGKIDIVIASSDYPGTSSLVYEQIDNAKFNNVTETSGLKLIRAHGIALLDYDRDGDYDIMMGQSLMRWTVNDEPNKPTDSFIHLFENTTGQNNNKIMIDIKGSGSKNKSNKDAIGAKIIVEANGKKFVRTIQGGYGLTGIQKDPFVIIGIEDNCKADKITVFWPNKTRSQTVLTDVPANYVLKIVEDSDLQYLTLEEYRGE